MIQALSCTVSWRKYAFPSQLRTSGGRAASASARGPGGSNWAMTTELTPMFQWLYVVRWRASFRANPSQSHIPPEYRVDAEARTTVVSTNPPKKRACRGSRSFR